MKKEERLLLFFRACRSGAGCGFRGVRCRIGSLAMGGCVCGGFPDVAGRAVARAARVGAVDLSRVLARLLDCAADAEALHILVGGYFRIDIVSLDHQCQRHSQNEECHRRQGAEKNDQPGCHILNFIP